MSTPNKKQQAWMQRVEKLLSNPPPGIGLYTIGDRDLHVYDSKQEDAIHALMDRGQGCDFCAAVDKLNAGFGVIEAAMNIHSTSG
jgi:hypothetical protein